MEFDGIDDVIEISDSQSLNFSNTNLSIFAWVYPISKGARDLCIGNYIIIQNIDIEPAQSSNSLILEFNAAIITSRDNVTGAFSLFINLLPIIIIGFFSVIVLGFFFGMKEASENQSYELSIKYTDPKKMVEFIVGVIIIGVMLIVGILIVVSIAG